MCRRYTTSYFSCDYCTPLALTVFYFDIFSCVKPLTPLGQPDAFVCGNTNSEAMANNERKDGRGIERDEEIMTWFGKRFNTQESFLDLENGKKEKSVLPIECSSYVKRTSKYPVQDLPILDNRVHRSYRTTSVCWSSCLLFGDCEFPFSCCAERGSTSF